MQAAQLMALRRMEVREVPDPVPAPGEVLVRVAAAGICGTDRHLFLGEFPCTPPVTLGHEFSGTVEALGQGVTGLTVGDEVACDPNIFCGIFPFCRAGRVNLCEANVAIGLQRDGGFAELAAIPAHRALPLPQGLGLREAALSEPLACCVHALDVAAIRPGERAVVLGGGVIGLLCVQLARLAGADVMLVTRSPDRRRIGEDLGAAAVASVDEALAAWLRGADVVLECAGVAETVQVSPRLAAKGGRIVIVGVMPRGEAVALEPYDLLLREVSLLTAFINPFTQSRAMALMASGAVHAAPLITREVGRDEVPRLLAERPGPAEVKVLVVG